MTFFILFWCFSLPTTINIDFDFILLEVLLFTSDHSFLNKKEQSLFLELFIGLQRNIYEMKGLKIDLFVPFLSKLDILLYTSYFPVFI